VPETAGMYQLPGMSFLAQVREVWLIAFNEGGSDLTRLSAAAVTLSSWHMITHRITFYIDGVVDATFSGFTSPNAPIPADAFIGKDNPNVTGAYFLKGAVDKMHIYDKALTKKEIQRL